MQIQAYLDNLFDVGALLEDAETKNALLEHMEELQEHNTQVDLLFIRWTVHSACVLQPLASSLTQNDSDVVCKWNFCTCVTAEQQASGEREGGDGESLRVGEEADSDHKRSGAPKGREHTPAFILTFTKVIPGVWEREQIK